MRGGVVIATTAVTAFYTHTNGVGPGGDENLGCVSGPQTPNRQRSELTDGPRWYEYIDKCLCDQSDGGSLSADGQSRKHEGSTWAGTGEWKRKQEEK